MTINRPVLGVSALITNGGRVLLVKRAREPLLGMWSFPGGHVEGGETLAAAAAREVAEETGIAAGALRRIDVVEVPGGAGGHFVLVVFTGEGAGEPRAGDDAAEARWVDVKDIAGLTMTDDTRRLIAEHLRHA